MIFCKYRVLGYHKNSSNCTSVRNNRMRERVFHFLKSNSQSYVKAIEKDKAAGGELLMMLISVTNI